MYAIVKSGGKQYTVKPGDVLRVEKLDAALGAELKLTDVLMVGGEKTFVGDTAGKATVTVVVTNQQRGPKVVVFKKKRRQGYRRMGGHRQPYTELFVVSITNPEGHTANADSKPHIFSPEKKAMKDAKSEEVRLAHKEAMRKGDADGAVETSVKASTEGATRSSSAKSASSGKRVAGSAKRKAGKGGSRKGKSARSGGARKGAKRTGRTAKK